MKEKEEDTILTISQFIEKGIFVVPNFQRGYKWAVENHEGVIPIEKLIDDFLNAFNRDEANYYIQGVTVYEEIDNKIRKVVLIDGQQRTTSLYLILKYLGSNIIPEINYEIREESNLVLNKFKVENGKFAYKDIESDKYNLQDIHYFVAAINIAHRRLEKIDKNLFIKFILEKVKLYYIVIDKEKSTQAFSMLNGYKAKIKDEELIKASLLSKVSKAHSSQKTTEWDLNNLRSKYAREWDKWLYWWNNSDVQYFFKETSRPLGLLLKYYYNQNSQNSNLPFNYQNFNKLFLANGNCKLVFKSLRDLQKKFEQFYYDPYYYNFLGIIINTTYQSEREKALLYYLDDKVENLKVEEYAKWILVGATHLETVTDQLNDLGTFDRIDKAVNVYNSLSEPFVYCDENDQELPDRKEMAFMQLLRMNVEKDNSFRRKFDFKIWDERSLEHIWPKSRKDEIQWLDGTSVHCIGNLVLLNGPDNSSFGAKDPRDKKNAFFLNDKLRQSMKLLHTVSIFTFDDWKRDDILNNKSAFLENFKSTYKLKF